MSAQPQVKSLREVARGTPNLAPRQVFDAVHRLLHAIRFDNHRREITGVKGGECFIALSCLADRPWVQQRRAQLVELSPLLIFLPGRCDLTLSAKDFVTGQFFSHDVVDTVDYGDPELLKKIFVFLDNSKVVVPANFSVRLKQAQAGLSAPLVSQKRRKK